MSCKDNRAELDASFSMCPKYEKHDLSDEQIEEIAERAAEKAVAKAENLMYQRIGKGVMGRLYWLVGFAAVALWIILVKYGVIKPL